mmetsp:Transcript_47506/g.118704  ORF Transcript_47506/g.118704 Transcript_47506/m.118704 type:complete len:246 (+) Transcript_47506:49-786(+)
MVGESASATSPPPHLPAQGELVIVELRPTEEASHGLPRRLLDANREWPNNATGKRNEEMWKGSRLYRIVNCGDKDDAGCTWDKATAENQTLIIIGREEDCEHVRGFYKGGFPLRIPDEVNLDRLRQQLVTDWGIAVEKDEMISTQVLRGLVVKLSAKVSRWWSDCPLWGSRRRSSSSGHQAHPSSRRGPSETNGPSQPFLEPSGGPSSSNGGTGRPSMPSSRETAGAGAVRARVQEIPPHLSIGP